MERLFYANHHFFWDVDHMGSPRTKKPNPEFFSRAQIGMIFGISITQFDRDVRPHLHDSVTQKIGRRVYFRAVDVHKYLVDKAAIKSPSPNVGDDPLLWGDSSPALERYREARAIDAERKNEVAAGGLVSRELIARQLDRLAALLRGLGDRLGRHTTLTGKEAQALLNDAITTCEFRETPEACTTCPHSGVNSQ